RVAAPVGVAGSVRTRRSSDLIAAGVDVHPLGRHRSVAGRRAVDVDLRADGHVALRRRGRLGDLGRGGGGHGLGATGGADGEGGAVGGGHLTGGVAAGGRRLGG